MVFKHALLTNVILVTEFTDILSSDIYSWDFYCYMRFFLFISIKELYSKLQDIYKWPAVIMAL